MPHFDPSWSCCLPLGKHPSCNRWIWPKQVAPRPLTFCFTMMVGKAALGRVRRGAKELDRKRGDQPRGQEGEDRLSSLWPLEKRFARFLKFCLGPLGQDDAVVREGPKHSVKKGNVFGTIERGWACAQDASCTPSAHSSLTIPHPTREMPGLKRSGVGEGESELGADFTSLAVL